MDLLLDEDIYTNDIQYFFSLHGLRFEHMNTMMAESLSKRYGGEFREISVLNAWPSEAYRRANYIILNEQGYKLADELSKRVVYLPDYEDVNVEFCNSPEVAEITQKLLGKQKQVFVFPFTTSFLEPNLPGIVVLGPDAKIARELDSKVNQTKLFMQLGLPYNEARIFESEADIIDHAESLVPGYISAAYTSGGAESGLIYTTEMLHAFLANLRAINKENSFVVSKIFEDIVLAPNVNALVTAEGEVYTLMIADQILHGNRYLGNMYPTVASDHHIRKIKEITNIIGKYLAGRGYKGLFGCDFLINAHDELVMVDLNPRHQGGYVCNALALGKKDINLTDLELAALNDEAVNLNQEQLDTNLDFSWGHSKLMPSETGSKIIGEYTKNNILMPFSSIGESFVTEFYEKESVFVSGYIGYQVQTGTTRAEVEKKMLEVHTDFDAQVLGL